MHERDIVTAALVHEPSSSDGDLAATGAVRRAVTEHPQAADAAALGGRPATPAAGEFPLPPLELRLPSDTSPDLVEIFSLEATEHVEAISRFLGTLASTPDDRECLPDLRRTVHTLKGAAGMVSFRAVSTLAHRMEDLLDQLCEGSSVVSPELFDTMRVTTEALEDLVQGEADDDTLRRKIGDAFARYAGVLGLGAPPPREAAEEATETEAVERPPGPADRRGATDRGASAKVVRIPAGRLEDLVKLVGELVINRSTFEQHFAGLIRHVEELRLSTLRLGRIAQKLDAEYEVRALAGRGVAADGRSKPRPTTFRTHGFDELELDRYTEFHLLLRELTETSGDLAAVGSRLRDTINDFDGDLTRLRRLTGEVQDKVMQFRMVPLAGLASRLDRAVRATAEGCGKLADFVLEGEQVMIDKAVLEELADPLLHLLRNAVDHGLESLPVRRALGKPERGRIVVRACYEGTQTVIQVEDDGAGLSVERVRARAIERGEVSAAAAAQLGDQDVMAFVFRPGFSTAATISEVSGRGIGLDVVKSTVRRLKGEIRIDSIQGHGTRFTIRVPLTLAIVRVLLVRAAGQTFAIPLATVTRVIRVDLSTAERVGENRIVYEGNRTYSIAHLGQVLGWPCSTAVGWVPVLIVTAGDGHMAVAVDEILENRDAVVKTLGTHLRRVRGVSGATLLGDGSVVLILNPADFARDVGFVGDRTAAAPESSSAARDRTVLVVDDSLSVRQVLTGLIKKAGWTALQARDGLEALELVQRAASNPDVILLDVEMPRMDGYELTSTLRSQPAHKDIPIVMLTSRAGEKHRLKAMAVGATDYLVKPCQEEALLQRIEQLMRASCEAVDRT